MRVGVILDTDVSKKIKLENKKGIASIVGGIFFLVLMTSGFTVYYVALDSQSQMLNAQQIIADLEVNKIREKFTVSVSTDPNDNRLAIQVKNQGNNVVEIVDVWIINKTAISQPAKKYEVKYDDAIIPAGFSGDILANTPLYLGPYEHDIKVVSILGGIVIEKEFVPNTGGGGSGQSTGDLFMDFTSFEFCEPAVNDCTSDSSDWTSAWDGKIDTAYLWRIKIKNMGVEDIIMEQHSALFMLRAQTGGGGNLPRTFFIKADSTGMVEDPGAYADHSKIVPAGGNWVTFYFGVNAAGSTTLETSHFKTGINAVNVLIFGHQDVNDNRSYDDLVVCGCPGDPPYSQNMAFQSLRLL